MFRTAMSNDCACDKNTKRNGALTPSPSSLATTEIICPSEVAGSVIEVRPIKSMSSLLVEINIDEMKSVLSGVTSSKQSQC